METIYFKGTPCHTAGHIPAVGSKGYCYTLVTPELKEISCNDIKGRRVVLNIFPSLDTPVCAASVRRFNQEASHLTNATVLCVSMDLPFAAGRFCAADGLNNVIAASAFRTPTFAENYGVEMVDGPLAGLLARAVIILDENRKVIYSELVPEITEEPHYDEALDVLRTE